MKFFKRILSILAAAVICTGCANNVLPQNSHEPTVLKLSRPKHIPEFSKIVSDFNEYNSDIQIKFADAPSVTEERHQLYVSTLSGRDASVDIYWLNDEWIEEFAQKGYILPIDNEINPDDSRYIVDAKDWFSFDKKLYALPVGVDMDYVFYREDLIGKSPTNWDDVMAAVRSGSASARLCLESSDTQDMAYNLIQIKNAQNCSYDEALNMYKEIISSYDNLEDFPTDNISAFKTGSAAMLVGKGSLWRKFNSDTSAARGNVGVAAVFGKEPGKNLICAYGLAINANSKHKEAAIKFLDFINSKEAQRQLSRDCSVMPVIEELYSDAMILDANPYLKNAKDLIRKGIRYKDMGISGHTLKGVDSILLKFLSNKETSKNTGSALDSLIK